MTRNTNNSTAVVIEAATEDVILHESRDAAARRPRLLPVLAPAPVPSPPSASSSVSAYDPKSPPPSPRRSRKPSGGSAAASRSAREAARKSNHSRIEKLRREKINDALASLRQLVPVGEVEDVIEENKKGGADKEFKLDILERTVVYLTRLKERVVELEAAEEMRRASATRAEATRSSFDQGQETETRDDADELEDDRSSRPSPRPDDRRPSSIRLPPISSFLNADDEYEPLSPPHSGRAQPWHPSPTMPPALHLPGAASRPRIFADTTRKTQSERSWREEREDEAASTLIRFSAERSLLSPVSPKVSVGVYTPALVLGMSEIVSPDNDSDGRDRKRKKVA